MHQLVRQFQVCLYTMELEHSAETIKERLAAGPAHNYLRDWIYGGIDGAVTTFAVVSGVAGAQLSPWIILALGFATCLLTASPWPLVTSSGLRPSKTIYIAWRS